MSSDVQQVPIRPLFASVIHAAWRWFRLDSVADVYDCPHTTPDLVGDKFAPLVARSQDIRTGAFMAETAGHVSMETYRDRTKRVEPAFGDLLYSREGTYFGLAAEVPRQVRVCLGQRMVLIRPHASELDHSYLKYWLNSPQMAEHVHGFRDGTVAERLNLPVIRGLAIGAPSLAEQRAISQMLAAIDSRIALLRETNVTFEAIAQALFKSWFVDFEPVRAKQQGLAPAGMDEATAAMFPDGFEDSRRGSIPTGWKEASIYDIAQVIYGAPFASGKFNSKGIGRPLVRIRDLRGESPGVHTSETHPKGYVIKPGDIVVGMDGEFRAYLWGGEEAWLNQRVCVFVPKVGIPAALLRSTIEPQLAHIEATETATTVIHLGKGDIDRFVALVPGAGALAAFGALVDPLYSRIVTNKQTARTLAGLRDTLLPRLISGQLRLPGETET